MTLSFSLSLHHVQWILCYRIKNIAILHGTRGGHSNRLCTNTRDRGQELGQAVKAENLEGQAVKGTSQIRKSQGSSTVKVNRIQNIIKARYHTLNSVKSKAYLSDGQAVKALIKVKFFDRAVAGVGTESIGVTSPCGIYKATEANDFCVV